MYIDIQPLKPGEQKPFPQPLGFGHLFADRMFSQRYTPEKGWQDGRIGPYEPFVMDPATVVLHYGQEIFEASRLIAGPTAGSTCSGRGRTRRASTVPPSGWRWRCGILEDHVEAMASLVSVVHESVPSQPDSSLYIRPTLIATDVALGVHASKSYIHFIIASRWAPTSRRGSILSRCTCPAIRCAQCGARARAKTGGNYAASLYVAEEVQKLSSAQVLWLDAVDRRWRGGSRR